VTGFSRFFNQSITTRFKTWLAPRWQCSPAASAELSLRGVARAPQRFGELFRLPSEEAIVPGVAHKNGAVNLLGQSAYEQPFLASGRSHRRNQV
jgi:hypothetical protein